MAVDAELLQVLEQLPISFMSVSLIDRGVGADQETGCLGRFDAFDGCVEHAFALHRHVVILLHAVQVDVEEGPDAA